MTVYDLNSLFFLRFEFLMIVIILVEENFHFYCYQLWFSSWTLLKFNLLTSNIFSLHSLNYRLVSFIYWTFFHSKIGRKTFLIEKSHFSVIFFDFSSSSSLYTSRHQLQFNDLIFDFDRLRNQFIIYFHPRIDFIFT